MSCFNIKKYQYKDHLDNIRLSYQDKNNDGQVNSSEIVQENNYYPFGLMHKGYNVTINGVDNKYKYNGKELQDNNINGKQLSYYDFGARNYDPAIDRWMNIDPMAEISRSYSPYVYASDNPVYFIDPDGMAVEEFADRTTYTGSDAQNQFKRLAARYDPPIGVDAKNGQKHIDGKGVWIYSEAATTWVGQYGNKDGKRSRDITNTIELKNVNVKGYKSNYVSSGEYGPYKPDGIGITFSGSIDYNYSTYSFAFSLIADENGKLGGFITSGVGFSTNSGFDWNLGTSFDIIDIYGGATVFDAIQGYSMGQGLTYSNFGVSRYKSARTNSEGQFSFNNRAGATIHSINYNLKPSTGLNGSVTNTFYRLF